MGTATITPIAPDRSLQQRLAALERANDVRHYRAELKRDLYARRRDVRWILAAPPSEVLTMRVFDLLLAVPKCGRVKVNKILNAVKIAPSKKVGGLTDRQRAELVERLERLGRPA